MRWRNKMSREKPASECPKCGNDRLCCTCGKGKVDFENLIEITTEFRKGIMNRFMGVPLKVDTSLEGNQYYIAVSQELFNQIENERAKKG